MTSTSISKPSVALAHWRSGGAALRLPHLALRAGLLGLVIAGLAACGDDNAALVAQGKQTFRFDTFGDETRWTDALHMDQVVATVDPTTALSVGLKVDSDALPASVVAGIKDGSVSLTDPATTVALLKLDAVLGVKGTVQSVGGKDTL